MRHLIDGVGDLGTILFTVLCAVWLIDSAWEWHEWLRERRKSRHDHSRNDPID